MTSPIAGSPKGIDRPGIVSMSDGDQQRASSLGIWEYYECTLFGLTWWIIHRHLSSMSQLFLSPCEGKTWKVECYHCHCHLGRKKPDLMVCLVESAPTWCVALPSQATEETQRQGTRASSHTCSNRMMVVRLGYLWLRSRLRDGSCRVLQSTLRDWNLIIVALCEASEAEAF